MTPNPSIHRLAVQRASDANNYNGRYDAAAMGKKAIRQPALVALLSRAIREGYPPGPERERWLTRIVSADFGIEWSPKTAMTGAIAGTPAPKPTTGCRMTSRPGHRPPSTEGEGA
jgi:hypothetical protein